MKKNPAPASFPVRKLADNMSGLLRDAVGDAMLLQKTKGFKLNMFNWVNKKLGASACEVCMAGASMVCRLGVKMPTYGETTPSDMPTEIEHKLYAVNDMRDGDFFAAASYLALGASLTPKQKELLEKLRSLVTKHENTITGRAPWRIYLKAADELEAVGL